MKIKAASGIMLTLLFIGMLTLALNFQLAKATNLPVHNIDTGLDYATIHEAIYAPQTSDGHTILVDAGTYIWSDWSDTNVRVSKSLALVGENRSNTIIDGRGGGTIVYISADNVSISGFTIQNGTTGIYVDYSSGCNISDNTITINSWGIYVYESTLNIVSGNSITNNELGIEITIPISSYPTQNTISGNTITNNGYGIHLYRSTQNTIGGNTIVNNTNGIELFDSSNNTIYHNNFINNVRQATRTPFKNVWDNGYPSGGNYWSDYEERYPDAEELDGSGIWDTPYFIDENNQDNYPLMSLWSPTWSPEPPVEVVPFWMQWWFYAIVAVVIVALAVAVYFLKKRKPPTPTAPTPSIQD